MRRIACVVPAAVVLCFALAGCAGGGAGSAAGPSSPPSSTVRAGLEPGAGLIGLWKVDAAGEEGATWLKATSTELLVERDRRLIGFAWRTGDNRTIAVRSWWDGALDDPRVPWLSDATRFEPKGAGWTLLAEDGAVLAVLAPAASAPLPHGSAADIIAPPGDDERERLVVATPPLGGGVDPAGVVGRWVTGTATAEETRPFLALREDGTYRASDGCNGLAGAWAALPDGRFLATSSVQTEIGCANIQPVGSWIATAASIRVDGDAMTLYDASGVELAGFDRG